MHVMKTGVVTQWIIKIDYESRSLDLVSPFPMDRSAFVIYKGSIPGINAD